MPTENLTAPMPPMLAYTIHSPVSNNDNIRIMVGQAPNTTYIVPNVPNDAMYFYFLDRMNPRNKVFELVIPGNQNTAVPTVLQQYMSNPGLIFGMVTKSILLTHVPQGALFQYLLSYGASRALTAVEQLNAQGACGFYGWFTFAMTGQAGPRTPYPPATYEAGSFYHAALLELALMPDSKGNPPYGVYDHHAWE